MSRRGIVQLSGERVGVIDEIEGGTRGLAAGDLDDETQDSEG